MAECVLSAVFILLVFGRMNTNLDTDINWDYLHELSGNNPTFEQEILTLFCEDSTVCLQQLQAALMMPNLEAAKALIHHLKGSASNLRLTDIHTQAIVIETRLQQGQLEQAIGLLPALEQAFQRLQATLTQMGVTIDVNT